MEVLSIVLSYFVKNTRLWIILIFPVKFVSYLDAILDLTMVKLLIHQQFFVKKHAPEKFIRINTKKCSFDACEISPSYGIEKNKASFVKTMLPKLTLMF